MGLLVLAFDQRADSHRFKRTRELRPQLPTIVGNLDHLAFRLCLEQLDALLGESEVEREFVQGALAGWWAGAPEVTAVEQRKFQQPLCLELGIWNFP